MEITSETSVEDLVNEFDLSRANAKVTRDSFAIKKLLEIEKNHFKKHKNRVIPEKEFSELFEIK